MLAQAPQAEFYGGYIDNVALGMSKERWVQVNGYEDFYEVSDCGRVRGMLRQVRGKNGWGKRMPKIQKVKLSRAGYPIASLSKYGESKEIPVHRLVCRAFNGMPYGDKTNACHKNGIKTDNRASNLKWASHKENTADAFKHGTRGFGFNSSQTKLSRKKHAYLIKKYNPREIGSGRKLSIELKVSDATILQFVKSWKRFVLEDLESFFPGHQS